MRWICLKAGKIKLVIYTTTGSHSFPDEQTIRRNAVTYRMPCITTMSGARAAAEGSSLAAAGSYSRLESAGTARPAGASRRRGY